MFKRWIVGLDGMQPKKGDTCLYIVRELQLDLTLLAKNLESSHCPQLVEAGKDSEMRYQSQTAQDSLG